MKKVKLSSRQQGPDNQNLKITSQINLNGFTIFLGSKAQLFTLFKDADLSQSYLCQIIIKFAVSVIFAFFNHCSMWTTSNQC